MNLTIHGLNIIMPTFRIRKLRLRDEVNYQGPLATMRRASGWTQVGLAPEAGLLGGGSPVLCEASKAGRKTEGSCFLRRLIQRQKPRNRSI